MEVLLMGDILGFRSIPVTGLSLGAQPVQATADDGNAKALEEVPARPVQLQLCDDDDSAASLRTQIVAHLSKSPGMLASYANHEDALIRRSVAMNRDAPPYILEMLAHDSDARVLAALANNRSTPAQILSLLAQSFDRLTRIQVTLNPNTPMEAILRLGLDEDRDVAAAAHVQLARHK
jgi:hypothetical protein